MWELWGSKFRPSHWFGTSLIQQFVATAQAVTRSAKVNDFCAIWKAICDFLLVISSNLGPISHRLATIHPWQTAIRQTHRAINALHYSIAVTPGKRKNAWQYGPVKSQAGDNGENVDDAFVHQLLNGDTYCYEATRPTDPSTTHKPSTPLFHTSLRLPGSGISASLPLIQLKLIVASAERRSYVTQSVRLSVCRPN